ncbi:class II fumarate hydratase [Deferrisoma camini]|uniref:class II fumarate hydratase n=1 Tax=Deferrisoma camini TaxID=1035120 RepID=UPI00046CD3C4|nr:class II fumarate hydratase [Deferrisoma camini]
MPDRIEHDTMGEVRVPQDAPWGAQTQRALENGIPVGRVPWAVIEALVRIKRAAARVNRELGLIPAEVADAVVEAAEGVLARRDEGAFPLSPFQTGSGTSTNMNVNEVLARRASARLGGRPVHPNDHVNRCQSSNDVFPTAIHVAALGGVEQGLLPAAGELARALGAKARALRTVVKLGRTHLMDALPVTLGQEFGGYARQVRSAAARIRAAAKGLAEVPLGGTAVGTGVNAHPEFAPRVLRLLSAETGLDLRRARDPFEAQGARDACVAVSGALRGLAVALTKVANDLRWMASGPRGGLGEIRLPALQPGSSIMPGKVNPVVPEAVIQAAAQVLGNDLAVAQGGMGGAFELNLMMPLIARNLLESISLLAEACRLLARRCVVGIEADRDRCRALAEASPALVTPLAEVVGYEAAARVVHEALARGVSLARAAADLGLGDEGELRRLLDPERLARPRR